MSLIQNLLAKADELDLMDARGQIQGIEEVSDILRQAAAYMAKPTYRSGYEKMIHDESTDMSWGAPF